jgi:hypothetical protein
MSNSPSINSTSSPLEQEQKERRKPDPILVSRTSRAQAYVENPKATVYQHHECSPKQMLQVLRQLNPYESLWALTNWIYGPPTEKIVLSLVIRLRNADDTEAEFLLENVGCWPKQT